jgi:hypothetical protein
MLRLWILILIGLVFRTLASYFAYGPMALDDFRHGLLPAYQFWANLEHTLPAYRSPLLVWILEFVLHIGSGFGIESPVAQARLMEFSLGLFSLPAIWGADRISRNLDYHTSMPAILVAVWGLMPFISTRAFGETVSMSLLVVAFAFLTTKAHFPLRDFHLGFLILGLAILFRFQVGVIYVALGLFFLIQRNWLALFSAFTSGILIFILQTIVDLSFGRSPLGTLFAYFAVNEGGAVGYGVHPWYNSWVPLLFVWFFPFCLLVWRKLLNAIITSPLISVSIFSFVLVHSFIPHKEERFIFPIFGLALVVMGWTIYNIFTDNSYGKYDKLKNKAFLTIFLVFNGLVLFLSTFSNPHAGEIAPLEYLTSSKKFVIVDHGSLLGKSWLKQFYLRAPNKLTPEKNFAADSLSSDVDTLMFLTSENSKKSELMARSNVPGFKCDGLEKVSSLSDQLVYFFNPAQNKRRRPTWFVKCVRQ